jgi:hypothetical protein
MFGLIDIIKYLTFISYIGFIIAGISGFVVVNDIFDLCKLLVSIIIVTNVPIIIYAELKSISKSDMRVIHYGRSYSQLILSLMAMGLSNIGIGFSIFGLTMFIANLLLGIFDCDDNRVDPIIVNPHNVNINNQN